jgi:hypothetical protein
MKTLLALTFLFLSIITQAADTLYQPKTILATMERVADWQLKDGRIVDRNIVGGIGLTPRVIPVFMHYLPLVVMKPM